MSIRRFNKAQIQELLNNPNVARCSEKSISYTKEFKQSAVEKQQKGMSTKDIFVEAGLDPSLVGEDTPKRCLRRWRIVFEARGLNALAIEMRGRHLGGGRPRVKELSDADKIKRLEIENAYLKAENDFLAKLRAAKKRQN